MNLSSAPFETVMGNYPTRTDKVGTGYSTVEQVMSGLPGTPCCAQMSCALNRSGILLPSSSWRRSNTLKSDPGKNDDTKYYYALAVDEIEAFLTDISGDGEQVNTADRHGFAAISNYLEGRVGILTFRSAGLRQYWVPGILEHTELWNRTETLQGASHDLFNRDFVKFWDIGLASGPPAWLTTYMQTV